MPDEAFARFVEDHPRLAVQLLRVLADRLRATTRLHVDQRGADLTRRVAAGLTQLASEIGVVGGPDERQVTLRISQSDLADWIGVEPRDDQPHPRAGCRAPRAGGHRPPAHRAARPRRPPPPRRGLTPTPGTAELAGLTTGITATDQQRSQPVRCRRSARGSRSRACLAGGRPPRAAGGRCRGGGRARRGPAIIRTTSLAIGGSSSSASPCTSSSGASSSSAISQPADCVASPTTPAACRPSATPVLTATAPPKLWPTTTKRRAPTRPGDVGGGGDVHHAAIEVVGSPVADPDGADALRREGLAQVVEQPVGRPEQATHGPAAHQHHVVGVARAVPQQGDQALHRVHLDVVEHGVTAFSCTAITPSASSGGFGSASVIAADDGSATSGTGVWGRRGGAMVARSRRRGRVAEARACKALYAGSIPAAASILRPELA